MSKFNINQNDDLPYEKCLKFGAASLTNDELLAVLLRTGTTKHNCLEVARHVLEASGEFGILGLRHLSLSRLKDIDGIGTVKAVMLMCVGELSARIAKASAPRFNQFTSASAVADYYMEDLRHLERERFILMQLNSKCMLIHETVLSIGTVNKTFVSARDIFMEALKNQAVYIIMIHNHPSGDSTPSREDINCTHIIQKAGNLLGILLIDHIIIGDNQYFSFKEKGLLEEKD